jgi:hypothetical protein
VDGGTEWSATGEVRMSTPLRDWEDWEIAQELRFRLRFENAGTNTPIDMHSQILCEAVARILDRLPEKRKR